MQQFKIQQAIMEVKNRKKAIMAIRNYLNCSYSNEVIEFKYEIVIDQLIENSLKIESLKPVNGITQISEGGQSMSFKGGSDAWTVTDDLKVLLPIPFVRML